MSTGLGDFVDIWLVHVLVGANLTWGWGQGPSTLAPKSIPCTHYKYALLWNRVTSRNGAYMKWHLQA